MRFVIAALSIVVIAAGGCDSHKSGTPPVSAPAPGSGTPSISASGSAAASASASSSPAPAIEFTVDGAGPYQLGTSLTDLRTTPGLTGVTSGGPPCPQDTVAHGVGDWTDVELRFRNDGRLYLAINRSMSIPTPSGAWLGTSVAQLKTIYAAITGVDLTRAGAAAFMVTTQSGGAILFDLNANKSVTDMIIGDSTLLKANFATGGAYC